LNKFYFLVTKSLPIIGQAFLWAESIPPFDKLVGLAALLKTSIYRENQKRRGYN
jgi:hypothetical protein